MQKRSNKSQRLLVQRSASMFISNRFVFAVLFSLIFSGCASKISLTQKHTFSEQDLDSNNSAKLEGTIITLIADNQKAMTLTEPVFEQSMAAESTVNTAHRRPSLDEFSLDIVEHIVSSTSPDLIIHGGDLLNNSCTSEFKTAVETLNSSNTPWFIAPGNHDGYYLGIASTMHISRAFNPFRNGLLDERAGWALTCNSIVKKRENGTTGFFDIKNYEKYENSVADKRTFNYLYLDEIGVFQHKGIESKTEMSADYEGYTLHCKSFAENPLSFFLAEVCWTQFNTDAKEYIATNNFTYSGEHGLIAQWEEFTPWKNFVVQRLVIPYEKKTLEVLIVDTSSYTNERAVNDYGQYKISTYGAADAGNIPKEQQEILNNWLSKSSADEIVIVGHHPLLDFDETSFAFIKHAKANYPVSMYISGDTHDGYDAIQKLKNDPKFQGVREVNLGSTIDAPIEYALMGSSSNRRTLVQRYSLTPMEETRHNKKGLKKTALLKGVPKNYAMFDDSVWKSCEQAGWRFSHSNPVWNPLGITEYQSRFNFVPLKRPLSWIGLHYIFNPLSTRDIRNKSLEAYKISRLVYLSEVFNGLMTTFNLKKSNELQVLESDVEESIRAVRGKEFSIYNDHQDESFNDVLFRLDKLITQYRRETNNSPEASQYKVCAALYDAESEYRDSFFESLKD